MAGRKSPTFIIYIHKETLNRHPITFGKISYFNFTELQLFILFKFDNYQLSVCESIVHSFTSS